MQNLSKRMKCSLLTSEIHFLRVEARWPRDSMHIVSMNKFRSDENAELVKENEGF